MDAKFIDDIRGFNNRAYVEEAKLVEDDLKNLKIIVDKLQSSVPQIQSEVDREYYYCYGAGKPKTPAPQSTIIFLAKGAAYGTKIDNTNSQSANLSQLKTSGGSGASQSSNSQTSSMSAVVVPKCCK